MDHTPQPSHVPAAVLIMVCQAMKKPLTKALSTTVVKRLNIKHAFLCWIRLHVGPRYQGFIIFELFNITILDSHPHVKSFRQSTNMPKISGCRERMVSRANSFAQHILDGNEHPEHAVRKMLTLSRTRLGQSL